MRTFLSIVFALISSLAFGQDITHELDVNIDVKTGKLEVKDHIDLVGDNFKNIKAIQFRLNGNLEIVSAGKKIKIESSEIIENEDGASYREHVISAKSLKKVLSSGMDLVYEGVIKDEIKAGAAEYARGFSETTGTISEKGIYLAGSTYWLPKFTESKLLNYNIDVNIDTSWLVLSQGTRTINEIVENKRHIRYESPEPMDEVYLVGGQWTEYTQSNGRVLFQALLREPDEKLAMKYLGATQGYLAMYEDLIGPYPFSKFALVENFWETGYGMPSFTLLGPKVIRFPWILFSSYPHELLHNYWGNSVYVDYETGNWCEGITVYMADHLLKEQQGQGAEYRQASLQKYTDYVNPQNDFPISEFLSRNNSAEEAVGYSKSMMINNMLRDKYGDEVFLKAYSKFYNDQKFKISGFDDIQAGFEAVTGDKLDNFFDQWVRRTGAPTLNLQDVKVSSSDKGYELNFSLAQVQDEEIFALEIPAYVYLEGEEEVKALRLSSKERQTTYTYRFEKRPLKLEIDPRFQIFRRLHREEVPTTLTQMFGAKEALFIIPSESENKDSYMALASMWKSTQEAQGKKIEIVEDSKLDALPANTTVWVAGKNNKFAEEAALPAEHMVAIGKKDSAVISEAKSDKSLVYAIHNPGNKDLTMGFISSNDAQAITALGRKLLHYGKYSYLTFEGSGAQNILKGIFPAVGSPLNFGISYDGEIIPAKARISPRQALTESN